LRGKIKIVKIPEVKKPSKEILSQIQALKKEEGMIAASEPETWEWFLGKKLLAALKNARFKYLQRTFYFIRISYPSAHEFSFQIPPQCYILL
jgi:hypothetical protein